MCHKNRRSDCGGTHQYDLLTEGEAGGSQVKNKNNKNKRNKEKLKDYEFIMLMNQHSLVQIRIWDTTAIGNKG